jgi:hypothetical protein
MRLRDDYLASMAFCDNWLISHATQHSLSSLLGLGQATGQKAINNSNNDYWLVSVH